MKLDQEIILVFTNQDGMETRLTTTIERVLERTTEDFYEDLEEECNSSGCNNESQNFCDCGQLYQDYEITEVII